VVLVVGTTVVAELGVRLPYWLVGLIGAALVSVTFTIAEVALRRRGRREGS
jgi:hypothetical protein